LKTERFPALVLSVLVLALALSTSGCGSASQSTKATVYGEGTEQRTAVAAAADNAIADVAKSPDIDTPGTLSAGILLAGADSASPPLEYRAVVISKVGGEEKKETALVGFEWDLCRAIAKKMGLDAQYVRTSWSDLVSELEQGRLDILVSAISTTPDRLQQLAATDTYLAADLAICTNKNAALADERALKGKIIGVQLDTPAQAAVSGIDGVAEVRTYTQIPRAFQDLNSGNLDAVVADGIMTDWILDNSPDYKETLRVSGQIETGEGYAFWCPKASQELLTAMNAALAELRDEGVYLKICRKWGLAAH
jgi:ABC-type amino acid transport substrate-binding protein